MRGALTLMLGIGWAVSAEAQPRAECRQALALGLDVSGSVDAREYRLQLDGLAMALTDPAVRAAFLQGPMVPVRLMVFEWSGLTDQRKLIDWQDITSAGQLDRIATTLRTTTDRRAADAPTALAAAMVYGAQEALAQECWRAVLDISGDGPGNRGAHPGDLTTQSLGTVVINGLVIGPENRANTTKNLHDVKTLDEHYRDYVIRGASAFIETARDYEDFAWAMRRKLLREIAPPALSWQGQAERAQ
jgi:hypothetical protein